MRVRDVVLFNITAVAGTRWLTTAANQFGFASLGLWLVAMVIFFLPSAAAVRELSDIDPRGGGLYRWVSRAFGPRHGFVAGWGYWVNNLFYYPSLLLTTAAMLAYVGGPSAVGLADNAWFIAIISLAGLWIAVLLNLVGLGVGKHLQNLGGYGTWVPALLFVALAAVALALHGSATPFSARALAPASFGLGSINLFATMTFAYAGLELAPTLGDEIEDPAATLRRGVTLSGVGIVAIYVIGTTAVLVALPHETVSLTNGVPQASAALVARLGTPVLAWVPALIALLLVLGNLGGVGAWLAGSARLPFVAGVDRALPPAFARLHPKWQTPYVALLVQGALSSVFVVAELVGTGVQNAYLALAQTTIILFFVPYLYVFAAYLRLRRRRGLRTAVTGVVGFLAVVLSIVLGFVPPGDEPHPAWYETKVVGGVVLFMVIGWFLARRGVRDRTADSRLPG